MSNRTICSVLPFNVMWTYWSKSRIRAPADSILQQAQWECVVLYCIVVLDKKLVIFSAASGRQPVGVGAVVYIGCWSGGGNHFFERPGGVYYSPPLAHLWYHLFAQLGRSEPGPGHLQVHLHQRKQQRLWRQKTGAGRWGDFSGREYAKQNVILFFLPGISHTGPRHA